MLPSPTRDRRLTGFVLRRYPFGEADYVLVLLSREGGLSRVVARGVRKAKSRLAGRLEPLREIHFQLAVGRGMPIVAQVEHARNFGALTSSYEPLAAAMAASELLSSFLVDDVPAEALYDGYAALLGALARPALDAAGAEVLLTSFALLVADQLGYRPDLRHCAGCSRELADDDAVFGLAIEAGGAACMDCQHAVPGRVRPLQTGAWALLVALQESALPVDPPPIPPAIATACRRAMAEYMAHRADGELRAAGMFDWSAPAPTPDDPGS